MTASLMPWAYGPFELLVHGELHFQASDDFDRRIALISFDNAIEVAITTYLSLHPTQRQGRQYPKEQIVRWLDNYHTKVEFLESECTTRDLAQQCDRATMIWYHNHRNEQYHGGTASIPGSRELNGIRATAFWVFSILFNVDNADALIESEARNRQGSQMVEIKDEWNRLIDQEYGTVEVAGNIYYTSEALYRIDPIAYGNTANKLLAGNFKDE